MKYCSCKHSAHRMDSGVYSIAYTWAPWRCTHMHSLSPQKGMFFVMMYFFWPHKWLTCFFSSPQLIDRYINKKTPYFPKSFWIKRMTIKNKIDLQMTFWFLTHYNHYCSSQLISFAPYIDLCILSCMTLFWQGFEIKGYAPIQLFAHSANIKYTLVCEHSLHHRYVYGPYIQNCLLEYCKV